MSFIRPSAPSTVWKTFGATLRAWNGTRLSHARELTCSGGRAGCSASRKELHATRVPPQEMKSPLPPMDNSPHRFFCRDSRAGCINQNGAGNSGSLFESSTPPCNAGLSDPYGDRFGEAVAEAEVAAAAAGDGALASPGFALINSTSKMSVAFGPISPPVPAGP